MKIPFMSGDSSFVVFVVRGQRIVCEKSEILESKLVLPGSFLSVLISDCKEDLIKIDSEKDAQHFRAIVECYSTHWTKVLSDYYKSILPQSFTPRGKFIFQCKILFSKMFHYYGIVQVTKVPTLEEQKHILERLRQPIEKFYHPILEFTKGYLFGINVLKKFIGVEHEKEYKLAASNCYDINKFLIYLKMRICGDYKVENDPKAGNKITIHSRLDKSDVYTFYFDEKNAKITDTNGNTYHLVKWVKPSVKLVYEQLNDSCLFDGVRYYCIYMDTILFRRSDFFRGDFLENPGVREIVDLGFLPYAINA